MPPHPKIRPIILAFLIFCALSCDKNGELEPDTVKRIVTFSLKKPGGISFAVGDIKIVIDSASIAVTVLLVPIGRS